MEQTFIHPELRPGEVFFINTDMQQFFSMAWISKRQGKIAYDGEGTKQKVDDWHPVFLSLEEIEEKQVDIQQIRKEFRLATFTG